MVSGVSKWPIMWFAHVGRKRNSNDSFVMGRKWIRKEADLRTERMETI